MTSPLPHWPAVTLLQSTSAWACSGLHWAELPDNGVLWPKLSSVIPSFLSSCPDIVQLSSGIRDQWDSRRFFLCSSSGLCMLLSAQIWGKPSTSSCINVRKSRACVRACASVPDTVRADKACHAWTWYGALTLVKTLDKQTGLWGSTCLSAVRIA